MMEDYEEEKDLDGVLNWGVYRTKYCTVVERLNNNNHNGVMGDEVFRFSPSGQLILRFSVREMDRGGVGGGERQQRDAGYENNQETGKIKEGTRLERLERRQDR